MKLHFAVFAVIAATAGATHAQSTPPDDLKAPSLLPAPAPSMGAPPLSDSFAELDRDKDGTVTRSEAERNEQVAMSFQRLDESRDGRLDLAEFAQLRAPTKK